jgi:hypothetical protein
VLVAAKNMTTLATLATADAAASKVWSLLLPDPSYHVAFLESRIGVDKFDSLVSYLPNSSFPLVRIRDQCYDFLKYLPPRKNV